MQATTSADAAAPDAHPARLLRGVRVGPYEITGFLGAGGMGEVYRAHDTNLNRVVALKLLPVDLASDPDRLRRFEQEARTASALQHPAIVTIYDAGQIGAQPFISMELIAGETLRESLSVGALPLRRGLKIAAHVGEGLAAAHDAGLVHRDLKPENIKISIDGFAKILDFGLAKRIPARARGDSPFDAMTETSPGMVVGTPAYMSPEQASGGRAEFPSDQFSFGAILYEILTGRRAFDRPTFAETLSAVIREEPPPIAQLNPAVPPPVRWIIERCLAKAPEERYAFTRDLARDLASVQEHLAELLASRRLRPGKRASGDATVAVLPVLNVLNDAKQETMADAMTDALVTALTQFNSLRVISRASSMTYKGRRASVPDVAEELGVEWVVLASIAKAGGEMRIAAQLVEAASDENRWAGSYTRRGRNVLSMQAEVAAAIAKEVEASLTRVNPFVRKSG
jgi:serine/threonine protein kinase